MPGTFTYDEATNTVEVTDGTEGNPAAFADMYAADQGGVDTDLLPAEAGAADNTLTFQIRATGDRALLINFIVAAKSAEADHIFITGTDAWNVAQTESLDVTAGNGTYQTTLRFRTITNIDCSDNAAGGGTVWADGTIQVTQDIFGAVNVPVMPELITNGSFTGDASGWSFVGTPWGYGINNIVATADSSNGFFEQDFSAIVGKTYILRYEVIENSIVGSDALFLSSSGFTGATEQIPTTVGKHILILTAVSTDNLKIVILGGSTGGTITLDNISIKDVIPQYKIDANVNFGDGSTSTWFTSLIDMVYFADGFGFEIKANATLQLGELVDDWGDDGSFWNVGPSANLTVIDTSIAATLLFYNSRIHSRDKDLFFRGGTIEINKGQMSYDISTEKTIFFSTITSLSINEFYYTGADSLDNRKIPILSEKIHLHNTVNGFKSQASFTTNNLLVTSSTNADINVASVVELILKNPLFTVETSEVVLVSGASLIHQPTFNLLTTDKTGDVLDLVAVTATYTHLLEGTDNQTYICILNHAGIDAITKPVTGSDWETYWELYTPEGTPTSGLGGEFDPGFDYKVNENEWGPVVTGPTGTLAEQVIQYKKWVGTSEKLEARIHKFLYTRSSHPDDTTKAVIVDAPITWRKDMGQSDSDLTALMETAIDNKIDTTTGKIDGVALVDVTTENTDMAGTDGANTVEPDPAGTAATLHGITDGKIDAIPTGAGSPSIE